MSTEICTRMFTADLFIITKKWKQPKYVITSEWKNKRFMEYHWAVKKEQGIDTCNNMPDMKACIMYNSSDRNYPKKEIHRHKMQICDCLGMGLQIENG